MLLHAVATVYYYSCASLRVPQLQPTERALPAQPVLAQPVLAEHYGLPTRARLRLVWVIPSLTEPNPLISSTDPYQKPRG